uniref:Uncharacterized protein n=1 Tax=Panagrolaimus sp. PS1159 TaxID=55785 RepID=A0AC35G5A0_9BILA
MLAGNGNHRNSKYKCLWDLLHIQIGTQFVSCFVLFGHLLSVFLLFLLKRDESFWKYEQLIELVIATLAFTGVFIGIHQSNPQYFLLCLGFLALKIIFSSGFIFFASIFYLAGIQHQPFATDNNVAYKDLLNGHFLLWGIVVMCYNIWVFDLVYHCYKYISDRGEVVLPQAHAVSVAVPKQIQIRLKK